MKPTIYRPIRYRHLTPPVCLYCLLNPSIGKTDYGSLGCKFCQAKTDKYITENFVVVGGCE